MLKLILVLVIAMAIANAGTCLGAEKSSLGAVYPEDKDARLMLGYEAAECTAFFMRVKECLVIARRPYSSTEKLILPFYMITTDLLGNVAERYIFDAGKKNTLKTKDCTIGNVLDFYSQKCASVLQKVNPDSAR